MKTDDDDNKLIGFIFCLLTFAIGLAIGLTINVNKVEQKTEPPSFLINLFKA